MAEKTFNADGASHSKTELRRGRVKVVPSAAPQPITEAEAAWLLSPAESASAPHEPPPGDQRPKAP